MAMNHFTGSSGSKKQFFGVKRTIPVMKQLKTSLRGKTRRFKIGRQNTQQSSSTGRTASYSKKNTMDFRKMSKFRQEAVFFKKSEIGADSDRLKQSYIDDSPVATPRSPFMSTLDEVNKKFTIKPKDTKDTKLPTLSLFPHIEEEDVDGEPYVMKLERMQSPPGLLEDLGSGNDFMSPRIPTTVSKTSIRSIKLPSDAYETQNSQFLIKTKKFYFFIFLIDSKPLRTAL